MVKEWLASAMLFLAVTITSLCFVMLKPFETYKFMQYVVINHYSPVIGMMKYPDYAAGLAAAVVIGALGFVFSMIQFEKARQNEALQ